MDLFVLIFLALIIGINTGLIFYLYRKNIEQKKTIDNLVKNLLNHKANYDLNSKLTLEYLSRLERDITLLSSLPPNTTIN
tara:strand:- start:7395 stop:7634 length:240 start_codon:yes stop_codon:yes gene_type:complete